VRRSFTSRIVLLAAAASILGMPAEAYYHYTYYFNGNRSTPIRARFSLATGNTVTFVVNDAGPANYGAGDTFGSLLEEVRQAIAAWNQVPASQLKLVFGGLEQYPQNENTPGADITFMDLPPGLLGYASPNLPSKPALQNDANGQFIPIQRSTVVLTNDTSEAPGPTYQEGFFTTAVHEIGHALGLQHTWTGAAMTPSAVGRNTTRARAIDADDIAALSVLYGSPNWSNQYGSISGRVTFSNGTPVSMASVVALPLNGPGVSALTNPDGSYTINGLPTNSYLLYVHPLPPDALPYNGEGLLPPEDQNGAVTSQPNGAFQTVFFPGTLDPTSLTPFAVTAGASYQSMNFTVRPQNSVSLYDVESWSYIDPGTHNYTSTPGSVAINPSPAFANPTQAQMLLAASANSMNMPSSLQSLTILGGFAPAPYQANCNASLNRPCFYTSGPWMVGFFNPPPAPGTGLRHMVFNMGNDIFVLPNAVTLVQNPPPMVNSVNSNSDGSVTISGTGFAPDTAIYFDGLSVAGTFNSNTSITVTPPPGNSGQTSVVAAYNSDGQNSTLLQYPGSPITNLPTYQYPSSGTPSLNINTPALPTTTGPAGFMAMVDISGSNTNFANGQVAVGFGTTDITVSRVWVLSPIHLLANVVVAPNAAIGSTEVSVVSGFQVANQQFGFQIQTPNPALPVIGAVVNGQAGQATIYPGAVATIYGTNLPGSVSSAPLTLTAAANPGQSIPLTVLYASSSQVNFQIPQNFPTGPAILNLGNGNGSVTLVVPIALAPPSIMAVVNGNNSLVDSTHSAGQGDVLTIQVNGLDPTVASNPSRVQVTVGGFSMPVISVSSAQIQFSLNRSFGGTVVPVAVVVDGSASMGYPILVR
jgi:Carboxypeptidase regulatory-like domain/Matrixin/IPT/TIG domain